MSFKEFMTNNDRAFKKLSIFDFDDTLVFTPHPKEGRKAYYEATGKEWNWGKAWWRVAASLEPPVIPNPAPLNMLNQELVKEAYANIREPGHYVVVMTGREEKLQRQVERILENYSIKPNEVVLTPLGEKTISFKLRKIKEYVQRFSKLEEVQIWDDKGSTKAKMMDNPEENHIESFRKLGDMVVEIKQCQDPELKFKFKANEVISPVVATFQVQEEAKKQHEEEKKKRLQI